MIAFNIGNARFNYRVAGVALHDDRVLLHYAPEDDFWFLPGGRCEILESSADTLRREMREELGVDVEIKRLLWVVENFFTWVDGTPFHELSFYYLVAIPPESSLHMHIGVFVGSEDANFRWYRLDELEGMRVQPAFLREGLRSLPDTIQHIVNIDSKEDDSRVTPS